MEPFSSDSHAAKQFVAYTQIEPQTIWAFQFRVESRKRDRAEILWYVGEIDFTARREIDTAGRTLGNTVLVRIRPASRSLNELHVRRIVERCNPCSRSRFEPVEAEAKGRFSVAEQVVHHACPRRERSPNRQMNIPECRDVGEAPVLCRLPRHLLADVLPSQAISDRQPFNSPRILAENSQIHVERILPTSGCR